LGATSFDDLVAIFERLSRRVNWGQPSNDARLDIVHPARYVLREVEAPRFYRPSDPVVLIQSEDIAPTKRHGADGHHSDDGLLPCQIANLEPIAPIKTWQGSELPQALAAIAEHVSTLPKDEGTPGVRTWRHQPWHPYAMEWQVKVSPDVEGGNHDPTHPSYDADFVHRHHQLREADVDLTVQASDTTSPRIDSGLYSGHAILVDHASKVLRDKLDAYLKRASKSTKDASPVALETLDRLREIETCVSAMPEVLSQSLDGLHEAFLQRHQILQLPIDDPLGFEDLAGFTQKVRKVTAGRHGNAPLRERDFMPIRAGQMALRKLRVIDNFGRTREILGDKAQHAIRVAEPMQDRSDTETIALVPRLTQPARLNFRWLAAGGTGEGKTWDTTVQEANTHPASTPICGWLMPNWLDASLSVHEASGAALGTIMRHNDGVVWRSAPGDDDPLLSINRPHPRLNRHLRKLLVSIIKDLGNKDPGFFATFLNTIGNALESISPEGFSHHRSQALLIGRPVAVVRACVDLEVKGPPIADQSVGAVVADMQAAIGAQDTPRPQPRLRFSAYGSEADVLRVALETGDIAALRGAFERRMMSFARSDNDVSLLAGATEGDWVLSYANRHFELSVSKRSVRVLQRSERNSNAFTQVQFPIRIGEAQQLNDGLIGYFIEDPDAGGYHYQDDIFFAPQGAPRIELTPGLTTDTPQLVGDQLDLGHIPTALRSRLDLPPEAKVTIHKSGHRWRIDTNERVYEVTRSRAGHNLVELNSSPSPHLKTHWKAPLNLSCSVDDAPLVLTMLMDPQGSVHAVSGILPTKAITLPSEYIVEALRNIEVSFLIAPILTAADTTHLPLWDQDGLTWRWLTRAGDNWTTSSDLKPISGQAEVAPGQRLVEGWLHLKQDKS
jgi:hypothetical protein